MYLKEILIEVLKRSKRSIITYCINTIFILGFYYLLIGIEAITYPFFVSILILLVYIFVEVISYKELCHKLHIAKNSPDYEDESDDKIFNIISSLHRNYNKKLHTIDQKYKEKLFFFSQWIHNMKTSSTIIDLACEKGFHKDFNQRILKDIKDENERLKSNLEQGLNFLRLDDFAKDYAIDEVSVHDMVCNVINSKKRDFIYNGVYPKVELDKRLSVYTDVKWCSYIIHQIINNSIKYSPKNSSKYIRISGKRNEETTSLIIEDEGLGIDKEHISRVFEPFFTGNNGRKNSNSTGIGLYMVKKICESLKHSVQIKSQRNKGTSVIITFIHPNNLLKM
ncbi:MAG: sensor histidine kinase [Anaeromicrobium sp.]|jgi:signal transduction histidine kinase|uniref:sensor histidine kinase n=1 Tax=Anaeromicrobium sp. TaxID=1929132 RepID=UPI0025D620D2|nr:sensor histidine kinase [Anaeromicrobium sp.]MCT4592960.1 sensor histidine kinase [Anaeromicrobium sp.]